MSPLHLAAMEGYVDCVETLLSHKAYVNFIDFSEERFVKQGKERVVLNIAQYY